MDNDLNSHPRRIRDISASFNAQGSRIGGFVSLPNERTQFTFGKTPRQMQQENGLLGGLGRAQPFQLMQPHIRGSNRLSLPPRNGYVQQDMEPRAASNLGNHFRVTQNLHQGIALSQAPPRLWHQNAISPIGQLANAMLMQRPVPQANVELEPFNFFQGLHSGRLDQLQPQLQQMTPPFNLSGLQYSPVRQQACQESSSPFSVQASQASSPTIRASQRRTLYHSKPSATYQETEDGLEEDNNQPGAPKEHIAIPQEYKSQHKSPTFSLGNAPPMAHGIQLVSPHKLPDRFRQVFPYELFNAAQSKCFAPIYRTNDNVIVSAPTGSGKTAILELAICRLVESHQSGEFKVVYQAPTKSLCSERMRDWQKKFSHLNLAVAELTGDTNHYEMTKVRDASIIVTTPEKWDSITRKWTDHHKLVQMVKLFLIDEVHILKDARGATLEAVVSRMKTMGVDVRFVALSATVPNSQDIAVWLGKDHTNQHLPAHREIFGEDFRPVKLQKHIHGFDGRMNDFAFDRVLNGKLTSLIQKYTHKKPIMVFCFTRKSCEATAIILAEWWTRQQPVKRAWPAPTQRTIVITRELQELVECGVSYHHAGLVPQDRQAVEQSFLKGDINVICCTSTLAVGVNLPCHMVVLKGTAGFSDGRLGEYSDLEVMQMLGRAGRPQFEDSAVAVVMTRSDKIERYKKMISGQEILESTLHLGLIEHLNSEISLGSVRDLYQAKRWLCGTFLSVRMRQNPNYYKIDGINEGGDTDRRLELVCERDIKLLQEHQLITNEERIGCTEYGEAMCRYMVNFETMKLLLGIPNQAKTEQILNTICQASEFQDLRMKPSERPVLREFNKSPFIKYPINENVTTTAHKVSLMIQVQLGGLEHPTGKEFSAIRRQFMTETSVIFDRIQRLIRCVVDCKIVDGDGVATRHALELARSLSAEFWENSNLQLRQIPQVGPAAVRKFVNKGINSIEKLYLKETSQIELILSKNPPFGKKIKDELAGFPRLELDAEIEGRVVSKSGQKPKVKFKARVGYQNQKVPVWNKKRPSLTFMAETSGGLLVHFWRGNVQKLERNGYELRFLAELSDFNEEIRCFVACDEIVGTGKSCILQHDLPDSAFPVPRPEEARFGAKFKEDGFSETDEYGSDGLGDDDMLAVVQSVEKVESDYGSDDFIDIDDIDNLPKKKDLQKAAKEVYEELRESTQMANGKWTCFHDCRDGGLLKNGKQCKHKCCHEGLEKRPKDKQRRKLSGSTQEQESIQRNNGDLTDKSARKSQRPVSKSSATGLERKRKAQTKDSNCKLKSSLESDSDLDSVELVDLANEGRPVAYSDLAPRTYKKLDSLHTSIQKDKPMILPKQKPQFSYSRSVQPALSFLDRKEKKEDLFITGSSDESIDLPSPSALVSRDEIDDFDSVLGEQYDPFSEDTLTYQNEPTSSHQNQDDSLMNHKASMRDFGEPIMLRPPSPQVTMSFANELFNFDAFANNSKDFDSQPDFLPKQPFEVMKMDEPAASAQNERKHKLSASQESPEAKHRRILNGTATGQTLQVSSMPAWVKEFDSEIIESLMEFVDFVD